jgi:uncharacterized glyoxalase superfamily protein PhnB
MNNRSMPSSAVIPVLAYPDVREAVEWLCRCFGFTERLRIGTHRAQLSIGDGAVVVTEQRPNSGAWSLDPGTSAALPAGGFSHSIMVRVPDVDRHYAHAKLAGVWVVSAPTDHPYGERQYTAEDVAGHRWTFTQTTADVDPASWGGLLVR